jgi:transposase-like protein
MERKDYKRYSREFKLEAVRLAGLGEKPKAQIARELGIRVNQLRKWRLDFELE